MRNWRNHPELVFLRERRSKKNLQVLVDEVKAELAAAVTGTQKMPRVRQKVGSEQYLKIYCKNEFKPLLKGVKK